MAGLKGQQIGRIAKAIGDVYTLDSFDEFLLTRLDKRLDRIVGSKGLDSAAIATVQKASMEGWDLELLRALRESRPHVAEVFTIAADQGLASLPMTEDALERTVREGAPHRDFPAVLARLARLQFRICRISYPIAAGRVLGTGILVGPSTVLTNLHVVSKVIDGTCRPDHVKLTFDFYKPGIGVAANTGHECKLGTNGWLVDSSPHDALDNDAKADPNDERSPDNLDYALLKVDTDIGLRPVGKAEHDADARGWIHAASDTPLPATNDVVFVFQHPDGEPLKWAQPDIVLGLNNNRTRIRYRVNTEPGSSGSPVFDAGFGLTALHHAGDPNFERFHRPGYNQGIPIGNIVRLINERGHGASLGDESEGSA